MRHPEYPTSIRLSVPDKKRLRKLASKWQLSLAGLIQMIIKQWLESQDKPALTRQEAPALIDGANLTDASSEPARSEDGKPFIGAME